MTDLDATATGTLDALVTGLSVTKNWSSWEVPVTSPPVSELASNAAYMIKRLQASLLKATVIRSLYWQVGQESNPQPAGLEIDAGGLMSSRRVLISYAALLHAFACISAYWLRGQLCRRGSPRPWKYKRREQHQAP
jgi:hypothetical protein